MSDRMTVAEVVTELRMRSDAACRERDDWFGGQSDGYDEAADLIEQHLTPQVLDEPDGPGDYHVEGVTAVCRVGRSSHTSQWMYYDGFGWEPLAGRRVAKVPPGPFSKETLE